MTTPFVALTVLALSAASAQALDITTLPPMNEKKLSGDIVLKGREVEALEVALRQFRADRFSTSGDLKHFTVEFYREPGKLFVAFLPDHHMPSQRATPARNKYGTFIHYAVSLRTLKIIGFHFERD